VFTYLQLQYNSLERNVTLKRISILRNSDQIIRPCLHIKNQHFLLTYCNEIQFIDPHGKPVLPYEQN
jgi:hypothetical protein